MVITETKPLLESNNTECLAASTLIALCFESRNKAHIAHLQTKSYSEHKALDDYYNEIILLADAFAESYEGRCGVIDYFPEIKINATSGLRIVQTVRDWIDKNRDTCGEFSELQNAIDDIVTLCNSTIYKLVNLK